MLAHQPGALPWSTEDMGAPPTPAARRQPFPEATVACDVDFRPATLGVSGNCIGDSGSWSAVRRCLVAHLNSAPFPPKFILVAYVR